MSSTNDFDDNYVRSFVDRPRDASPGPKSASRSPEPDGAVDITGLVRSYTITGGRSQSRIELAYEAMLNTSLGTNIDTLVFERQAIGRLCLAESLSVAEVSARLGIPIGVARVIAGDMIVEGLLDVQAPTANVSDDVSLILRLIEGVRAL